MKNLNTQKIEAVEYYVKYAVERANETRTELAQKLTDSNSNAEYALRWINGAYENIITGVMAEELNAALKNEELIAKHSLLEIFEMYLEQLRAELRRWYPENSTSPYSNACHNEKFNAMRKWVERLESVNRKGGC